MARLSSNSYGEKVCAESVWYQGCRGGPNREFPVEFMDKSPSRSRSHAPLIRRADEGIGDDHQGVSVNYCRSKYPDVFRLIQLPTGAFGPYKHG
jgi:hypothetical protein